jgi:uncharacterized protein YegL
VNDIEDPLGGITRRKLHIAMLLDRSKSMTGVRIQALNESMRTVLPLLKEASERNPQADVYVRQLEFSSGARWRTEWQPIKTFGDLWHYESLEPDGITDLGAALDLLTSELDPSRLGAFNYPPVVVLVTDGQPTDDWEAALKRFNESPFGKKRGRTVRAAVNVTDGDTETLAAFTGDPEMVVKADTSHQLTTFLKWATVSLSKHSSMGRSTTEGNPGAGDGSPPPPPPPAPPANPDDDVF